MTDSGPGETSSSAYEEGSTLSFYSEVIEKERIDASWSDIKHSLIEYLKKSMFIGLTYEEISDSKGVTSYVVIPDHKNSRVKRWDIICTFLDKRGVSTSGKPYLESYRIFLTFRPKIKDEFLLDLSKGGIIGQFTDSLFLLSKLPVDFNVIIFNQDIQFTRLVLNGQADIGNWSVVVGHTSKRKLRELTDPDNTFEIIKYIDGEFRRLNRQNPVKGVFLNNVDGVRRAAIEKYLGFSGFLFDKNSNSPAVVAARIQNNSFAKNTIIFSSFPKVVEDEYPRWKREMIGKGVPTQNVLIDPTPPKMQTVKMEAMEKLGFRPLDLDPSEEVSGVDGFLYLLRLEDYLDIGQAGSLSDPRNILGAVTLPGKRFGESEEVVMTIMDSPSNSVKVSEEGGEDTSMVIYNEEESTNQIVSILSLKGKTLDLILTRSPKYDNLQTIIKKFESSGTNIRKVFYFSHRYSCGPSDPERIEGGVADKVSYKLIDEKHLFLQPSQRIQGLFDVGTVYVGLLYPLNETITDSDINSLIRLAKRRLYRIYNIASLRTPEPIIIFKKRASMIAEMSSFGTKIPLRMFI